MSLFLIIEFHVRFLILLVFIVCLHSRKLGRVNGWCSLQKSVMYAGESDWFL